MGARENLSAGEQEEGVGVGALGMDPEIERKGVWGCQRWQWVNGSIEVLHPPRSRCLHQVEAMKMDWEEMD